MLKPVLRKNICNFKTKVYRFPFYMLPIYTTSAIILKTVKYGDSSLIVNTYTRDFGLMGLMVRGVYNNKKKSLPVLLQPMNVVEIVFTKNQKSNLNYLKEISSEKIFNTISANFYKCTILMFINEILYKTLKEEQPYWELFDYIKQSLILLDSLEKHYADLHLYFLAGLTKWLGIYPNFSHEGKWFDLSEGITTDLRPNHNYVLEKEYKSLFFNTFTDFPINYVPMNISIIQRRQLLDILLLYFELHVPGLHEIKSKTVLHEIVK